MITIRTVNRFMIMLAAPFIGILCGIILITNQYAYTELEPVEAVEIDVSSSYNESTAALSQSVELASYANKTIEQSYAKYDKSTELMSEIVPIIKQTIEYPQQIYDAFLLTKLGPPVATINSNRLKAQLFYKRNDQYNSYLVKIRLKTDDAMDMVLGSDELGKTSTTLQVAKRHGAAVAINAGGFADGNGRRYPLGTTIVNGHYVDGFQPSTNNLFFVGMNERNELIGGIFKKKESLDKLEPKFGASFVPILLQDGQSLEIPTKWKTSPLRAPRVVIANFKDDQLLLLVTDGYNTKGSAGATLTEIQKMLQNLDVVDAYNLDGGGSASLVFNGNLINHPSDGGLRSLPTHFLFYR